MLIKNDAQRKWLYGVVGAIGVVLAVHGIATETQITAWAGLANSLINGLAFINTSNGKHEA